MSYLNLGRKFIERQDYDPDELIALEVRGKLQDWSKVLESPASIIVAPANFGKTTEMKQRAMHLCGASEAAVFVALRRMADRGSLEKALSEPDMLAYRAWKSSPSGTLTLFVDSLDEAAAGKQESIEYLVSDIAAEVSWPNERVRWVISTRPAVLTPRIIEQLSDILGRSASIVHSASTTPLNEEGDAALASIATLAADTSPNLLRIFSMASLDGRQSEAYLRGKHLDIDATQLLRLARERGLSGFTRSPGGLDLLSAIDLLSTPPDSLTEVLNRVVKAIHVLRVTDHRMEAAGSISPDSLAQAAQRLASASLVCQLINIEMPAATLEIPEKALSARLIATPMLNETAINQLLNSQLFIDVGFHQVKMYPDELLPFLAAQRLAGLVESPDQALRLLQNFTWVSPSGERGVHREFLPMMGWLATLNPHCRFVILQYDPQALAFFGDLRSNLVPLADATDAMTECIRRLVDKGEAIGKGAYSLTSENYWQAGPERMAPVIGKLFDEYKEHYWARKVLLQVAATCKLNTLRILVLSHHMGDYQRFLEDSDAVHYLVELGIDEDLVGLSKAIKSSSNASDGLAALLLGQLGWTHFNPFEVVRLIDKQFVLGQRFFSITYELDHGDLLATATDKQLYQLCRGLVVRVARLRAQDRHGSSSYSHISDQYVELVVNTVAILLKRVGAPNPKKIAQFCLVLERLICSGYFRANEDTLRNALEGNALIRRALLAIVAQRSSLDDDWKLLMAVVGPRSACNYSADDVEATENSRLIRVYSEHLALVNAHPTQGPSTKVLRTRRDERYKVDAASKVALKKMLPSLRDGTATNGLGWVASWLLQTNPNSRYGEVNFNEFERAAGKEVAAAVRRGLSQAWRNDAPRYDTDDPRTTYHITAAGLQGLHLELGDGSNLPPLSDLEVRQALRYGIFEINGYPKWFWAVVQSYPVVAASELSKIAEDADTGLVSREHAEALFTSLAEAPEHIKKTLVPLAWQYLVQTRNSSENVISHILDAVMDVLADVDRLEFERIALDKMKNAFKSPEPAQPDSALNILRADAVLWASHWLLAFPTSFHKAVSKWGPKDADAVKEFLNHLASHFGRGRGAGLASIARGNDEEVAVLEHLYHWTMWAVDPAGDIKRPDGVVYSPGIREHAQDFRDSLIGIIASSNSQAAYDVIGRIKASAQVDNQTYLQRVQFELRERQFARKPLPQQKYDQFEKDFVADVTDSLSFAMAVHSDLQSVKYDIELGEHSLRSFFSELDFKLVNIKGAEGEKAGLALEAHFQRLLGSELNHHARSRYSVSVESHTAEAKRRDILCSRNEWRASIELKMSERWTLDEYLTALEKQLVGQYMRHNKATTGFLVLVLQTKNRKWKNSETGKWIEFNELLEILVRKAQELEGKNRSRYLRVIGIDATHPEDFRKVVKSTKIPARRSPSASSTKPPVKRRQPNKTKPS